MATDPAPPTGATYRFTGELWEAAVEATWVFVTVPIDQADEIADLVPRRPGFGSVRVEATIGSTTWRTSLFPDSKAGSYVLPVKAAVRRAEELDTGDRATVEVTVVAEEMGAS